MSETRHAKRMSPGPTDHSSPQDVSQLPPKRLAWDAVSFLVPGNWELVHYQFLKRRVRRVVIEDEYSMRMEAEWIRPRRKLDMQNILKRYERSSKRLTRLADRRKEISGLPRGWYATHYAFSEQVADGKSRGLHVVKHAMVTAFYLCPDSTLFCFVMLHFLPEDKDDPYKIMRLVAQDFRHHDNDELVPWQLYDISFELPRDFLLENTLFDIGSKLMIFRWNLRRFYLWHFSCADMFLKEGVVMEKWLAAHINDFGRIPGIIFSPGKQGEVLWKRRRRHLFAHREEIARWCFKYKILCRHNKKKNQLIAWVFNYRKPEDLNAIPLSLRFDRND